MRWVEKVPLPESTTIVVWPEGFDMVVRTRTTFRKGDMVFYWAALPQSFDGTRFGLTSEKRSFGPNYDNQGVCEVGANGWCTIRLKSPRPYIDADSGTYTHRQVHMRRAKRGASGGWTARTQTIVLNPNRRLSRTLRITYCRTRDPRVPSMWVRTEHDHRPTPTNLDAAIVAQNREHASKLMAQGYVSVFLPNSEK